MSLLSIDDVAARIEHLVELIYQFPFDQFLKQVLADHLEEHADDPRPWHYLRMGAFPVIGSVLDLVLWLKRRRLARNSFEGRLARSLPIGGVLSARQFCWLVISVWKRGFCKCMGPIPKYATQHHLACIRLLGLSTKRHSNWQYAQAKHFEWPVFDHPGGFPLFDRA